MVAVFHHHRRAVGQQFGSPAHHHGGGKSDFQDCIGALEGDDLEEADRHRKALNDFLARERIAAFAQVTAMTDFVAGALA